MIIANKRPLAGRRMFRPYILLLFSFFLLAESRAQDAHYWTNAYGTQAQLLGGLVVGSANDLSSVFYNPGALVSTTDSSLVLSTLSTEWTELKFTQDGDPPLSGKSNESGPAPGIFALRLPFEWPTSSRIAISYLLRTDVKTDLTGRSIIESPGGTTANEMLLIQNISESLLGVSIATALSDWVGAGATMFLAPASQRSRAQFVLQSVDSTGSGRTTVAFNDFYYNNFRMLFKLGFSFDMSPLTFGVAITTPSINLFNTSGWITSNISVTEVDSGATVVASHEEDLKSEWNSPLSVSVGAAYKLGATTIHVGAEWFAGVASYFVMETQGLPSIEQSLLRRRQPVVNVGIGAQHRLSPLLSLYGSVRTNNSYLRDGETSLAGFSTYNLTHATGGVSLTADFAEVTLGLSYGWGEDDEPPSPTLVQADPPNYEGRPSTISYSRFGFVLGFTLSL